MAYTPIQNTSDVSFSPTFANYYGTYYSNLVRPDRAKEIFLQHPTEKVGLTDFLRRLGYTMGNKNGYSMRTNVTFGHFEEERMQLAIRPDAQVAGPFLPGAAITFAVATGLEDPSTNYFPVRVNDVLEHARSGVQSIVTAINTAVLPWDVTITPKNGSEVAVGVGNNLEANDYFINLGNQFGEGTGPNTGMTHGLVFDEFQVQRFKEATGWTGDMMGVFNTWVDPDTNTAYWYNDLVDRTFNRHWYGISAALWGNDPTFNNPLVTDTTQQQTATGIQWYGSTYGHNEPYIAGSLTITQFRNIAKYLRQTGTGINKVLGFCDVEFQAEIEAMIEAFDPTGIRKFKPNVEEAKNLLAIPGVEDGMYEMMLSLNWNCIETLGTTFMFIPLEALDNPERFGVPGSQYTGGCLMMPYSASVNARYLGSEESMKRPIVELVYAGAEGYNRFLNVWQENSLTARQNGGSIQSNGFDNEKHHFLSHVGTHPKVGNSWVWLYRA